MASCFLRSRKPQYVINDANYLEYFKFYKLFIAFVTFASYVMGLELFTLLAGCIRSTTSGHKLQYYHYTLMLNINTMKRNVAAFCSKSFSLNTLFSSQPQETVYIHNLQKFLTKLYKMLVKTI